MATIIDGKALAKKLNAQTSERVKQLQDQHGITPGLVVIIVGTDPASQRYVRNKHRTAVRLGIYSIVRELPDTITQDELLKVVQEYNQDPKITGILVQDPLPKQINEKQITRSILPEKDVDGFHPESVGALSIGQEGYLSCTPAGMNITLI